MRELLPGPGTDVDPVTAYTLPPTTPSYVRAAMVSSADGAATVAGHVGPLSGPADQRMLQLLRALSDVILVGAGTIRAEGYGGPLIPDDWQRYRKARGLDAHPRLAVLSGRLAMDFGGPPFADCPQRPLVVTTSSAPEGRRQAAGAVADLVTAGTDRVGLPAAVSGLHARGLRHVLCEGGPTVLAQMFAAGMVDELCLTLAPNVVCGDGLRVTNGSPLPEPDHLRLTRLLEEDGFLFVSYTPQP
ncbi:MAG: pyrimidine reductase family protein [Streptosporangiales bacterium]